MGCRDCCHTFFGAILRTLNVFITLVGCAFIAYGAYLIAENGTHVSALAGGLVGVGALVALMAFVLVTCGHSNKCFLTMYMATFGFLMVGEIMLVCYFLIPSSRDKIIAEINPPAAALAEVRSHLEIGGYLVLGFIGFQIVSIVLAKMRKDYLQDKEDGDLDDPDYGKLNEDDRDIEVGRMKAAKSRYREKNSAMYEKYGISR